MRGARRHLQSLTFCTSPRSPSHSLRCLRCSLTIRAPHGVLVDGSNMCGCGACRRTALAALPLDSWWQSYREANAVFPARIGSLPRFPRPLPMPGIARGSRAVMPDAAVRESACAIRRGSVAVLEDDTVR